MNLLESFANALLKLEKQLEDKGNGDFEENGDDIVQLQSHIAQAREKCETLKGEIQCQCKPEPLGLDEQSIQIARLFAQHAKKRKVCCDIEFIEL